MKALKAQVVCLRCGADMVLNKEGGWRCISIFCIQGSYPGLLYTDNNGIKHDLT